MTSKKIKHGNLIKRKNSPYWFWQYLDSTAGYQKIRSTGTRVKSDAVEIAAQFADDYLKEVELKQSIKSQPVNFADYSSKWFESNCSSWKKRYCVDVRNILGGSLVPFFEDTLIQQIDSAQVREYKNERLEDVAGRKVNRALSILRQILLQANEDGLIDAMPVIRRCSETDTEAGRALSQDEIRRLFEAAASINDDFVRFIGLGYFAGLRHREINSRDWRNIDFKNNCILFDTNESTGATQKNKTAMRAPLPKPLADILKRVPEHERSGRVVCWIRDDGERLPCEYMRKTWETCCKIAKIKDASVHDLRRTFATAIYEKYGEQGYWLTRHKDVTTFLIYVRKQQERFFKDVDDAFDITMELLPQAGEHKISKES